jgi:hypothetical protein
MNRSFHRHNRFEKLREENLENDIKEKEHEIPEPWWYEETEKIQNPYTRLERLEDAKKIVEEEIKLNDKLGSGEISKERYDHEKLEVLGKKKAKFGTKCSLNSEDLSYDIIFDELENWDIIRSEDPKVTKMKEGVKKLINERGPEFAKDLADEMFEDGKLSKKAHQSILRQTRLHGKE